ncbi:hypothetical protein PR001_g19219 [Phytophthora rubi]|uniref:Uncharacterized protein n=1 Tax=Phytophthora rubi TaxID=129364 RepID=A0A6A3JU13_9STRA|nr:hypothetical protein PR001_g19219 [Phytophthora rubi]
MGHTGFSCSPGDPERGRIPLERYGPFSLGTPSTFRPRWWPTPTLLWSHLEHPECLVHLERPEEHPERLEHLPPLLRQLRADVPQQPQLPRCPAGRGSHRHRLVWSVQLRLQLNNSAHFRLQQASPAATMPSVLDLLDLARPVPMAVGSLQLVGPSVAIRWVALGLEPRWAALAAASVPVIALAEGC